MIKTTSIAAAAAALAFTGLSLTIAAPVFAKDVTVRYADLNLTSVAGQKTLERRLNAAARDACGYDMIDPGTRLRNPDAVACYNKALVQAHEHMAAVVERANGTRVATN
ncbi:UrcA family protein [Novosphingobium sp. PhB165]|uniref:UrcA family protein n=1 Tax=Novosphingobium sp. PhB165 TaxID=2485105 RepID=UPI00104ABAD1|nr:UrcA family protein [Novosphingobium sp. PhB165]TCM18629.1 UrcA family protein [Novosphingobium sp. PhB165]